MKLVRFKDGTYGVRRFDGKSLGFEYADLTTDHDRWISSGHVNMKNCHGTLEQATLRSDKGEAIGYTLLPFPKIVPFLIRVIVNAAIVYVLVKHVR